MLGQQDKRTWMYPSNQKIAMVAGMDQGWRGSYHGVIEDQILKEA